MPVPRNPIALAQLYARGRAAARYGAQRGIPGMQFDAFGRKLGLRGLLRACAVPGFSYLLVPVNSIRYFEFDYAFACLPKWPGRCLDVSSPALFSLFVAGQSPSTRILMANPDVADLNRSRRAAGKLNFGNIEAVGSKVDQLATGRERFDCIWSISVVEHICGEYEDREAIKFMYDLLNPGGRLILTIPVDRTCWDEYRDSDYYGTAGNCIGGRYFFQRWYDRAAIESRLVNSVGVAASHVQWFGETMPGKFDAHQRRWAELGYSCAVTDPVEIAHNFRYFRDWKDMPGQGVCGLTFEKAR